MCQESAAAFCTVWHLPAAPILNLYMHCFLYRSGMLVFDCHTEHLLSQMPTDGWLIHVPLAYKFSMAEAMMMESSFTDTFHVTDLAGALSTATTQHKCLPGKILAPALARSMQQAPHPVLQQALSLLAALTSPALDSQTFLMDLLRFHARGSSRLQIHLSALLVHHLLHPTLPTKQAWVQKLAAMHAEMRPSLRFLGLRCPIIASHGRPSI